MHVETEKYVGTHRRNSVGADCWWSAQRGTMDEVFEKVTIRRMELKNRLMMSAMVTNFSTGEGQVTERLIAYHRERAQGGVGMIETEAAYVHPAGKGYANQLGIYKDDLIAGLKAWVRTIHAHGAKAAVQLYHAGRRTSNTLTGYAVVSPSAIACFEGDTPPKGMIVADDTGGTLPKELTQEEIGQLVDCYSRAARRAKEASFDAVSIHAAHGYLVGSFLSPFTNKRQDDYGRDDKGRCRFLLEIIGAVRKEIGELPIMVKISGDEFVPGGLSLTDTKEIAPLIEEAGADAITVSAGTVGQSEEDYPLDKPTYAFLRSLPMYTPRGSYLYLAQGIKEKVQIPVIAVGRINTPSLIREVLEQEKVDLVALGRALLADPFFPRKMGGGDEKAIRICIACNQGCFENLFHQRSITCAINPRAGREDELKFDTTTKPKKIVVIGGGPAGIETARISSLRGHSVSLLEASDQLGGQLQLAYKAPNREEIKNYLDFLLGKMEELPVEIFTRVRVNSSLLRDLSPDILIFATGAKPWIPQFAESDVNSVLMAEEVLRGEKTVGEVVIVAGGGLVGCEVAELFGEQGKKVTIVEMLGDIIPDEFSDTKKYFENVMAKYRIRVLTESVIKRITEGTVIIEKRTGETESLCADTVVLALGYVSNLNAKEEIRPDPGCKVYEIGDCVKPRKIMDAVLDAYQLAVSL